MRFSQKTEEAMRQKAEDWFPAPSVALVRVEMTKRQPRPDLLPSGAYGPICEACYQATGEELRPHRLGHLLGRDWYIHTSGDGDDPVTVVHYGPHIIRRPKERT